MRTSVVCAPLLACLALYTVAPAIALPVPTLKPAGVADGYDDHTVATPRRRLFSRRRRSYGTTTSYYGSGTRVTTTRKSYGDKVSEAGGAAILGLICLCLTPCLLAYNEFKLVYSMKKYTQIAKVMVTVKDPNKPEEREDAEGGCCTVNCSPGRDPSADWVHTFGPIKSNGWRPSAVLGVPISGVSRYKVAKEVYQHWIEIVTETKKEDELGGDEVTTKIERKVPKSGWVTELKTGEIPEGTSNASEYWDAVSPVKATPGVSSNVSTLGKYLIPQSYLEGSIENMTWDDVVTTTTTCDIEGLKPKRMGQTVFLTDHSSDAAPKGGEVRIAIKTALPDDIQITIVGAEKGFSPPSSGGSAEDADVSRDSSSTPISETVGLANSSDTGELTFDPDHVVVGCGICKPGQALGKFHRVEVVPKDDDDGQISSEEMMDHARDEANLKAWIVRVLCFGLMFFGWSQLLSPIAEVFRFLPFLKDGLSIMLFVLACGCTCCCCCSQMAFFWASVRPLHVLALVALIYVLNAGLVAYVQATSMDYDGGDDELFGNGTGIATGSNSTAAP